MNAFGEIFCGAGGSCLGAVMAGGRPVWSIDINKWALETHWRNFGSMTIEADARRCDYSKLPGVDGLIFGFPCNDYSIVGEHQGLNGDYGPLYLCGVHAIEAQRPLWFVAENVSGIASANDGTAFERILSDLENAGPGYTITPHLYRFEEYGVPQTRHRYVIVGIRKQFGIRFVPPEPTTKGRPITAKEALRGVELAAANNERQKHPQDVVDRLKLIPPGENIWAVNDQLPEHLRLNVKPDGFRNSVIYRRLHPDQPSPTITARGGGGTHGYHWDEPRALTNRERARLQTFPDWFVFEGPPNEVRAQIGMAVPPEGARIIISSLFAQLAQVPSLMKAAV